MRKIWYADPKKEIDGNALCNPFLESPGRAGERSIIVFYLVAAGVFILDRISKLLVLEHLSGSIPVIANFFHLTLVHNQGVAFGFFANLRGLLLPVISISLLVILWMAHQPAFKNFRDQWVFGLIFGGALGNWVDRIQYGAVVDFLDFRIWPVFNIADSAISIGVGIYILYLFFGSTQKAKS